MCIQSKGISKGSCSDTKSSKEKDKEKTILEIYEIVKALIRTKNIKPYNYAQKLNRLYQLEYEDLEQEIITNIIQRFPVEPINNLYNFTRQATTNSLINLIRYYENGKQRHKFFANDIEFTKLMETKKQQIDKKSEDLTDKEYQEVIKKALIEMGVEVNKENIERMDTWIVLNEQIGGRTLKKKKPVKRQISEKVYFLQNQNNCLIKIGTTSTLKTRIKSLESETKSKLKLLGYIVGSYKIENKIHKDLKDYRLFGEWFVADGDLLLYINKLLISYGKNKIKI